MFDGEGMRGEKGVKEREEGDEGGVCD